MEKPDPTIEWTRDCRILLAGWISDRILEKSRLGPVNPTTLLQAITKIDLLMTKKKEDLEKARKKLTEDF